MFAYYVQIKKRTADIQKELIKIRKKKAGFPEGNLLCAKNNRYYKWYLIFGKKKKYLPKKNEDLARTLAQKKFYELREKELEAELKACEAYMKKAAAGNDKADLLLQHEEYGRLLGQTFQIGGSGSDPQINMELKQWVEEKYERCGKHPENLKVKATGGKYVRSKSEAIIDNLLFRAGIPFRYEGKLVLGNIVVYPDFIIRHPKTGEYYYWEHLGMMDDPEYVRDSVCRN